MAIGIILITPGSRSSKSCETSSESRSTPRTSCVRSLEPIEKPSKSLLNSSIIKTLFGISHMTYILSPFFTTSQAIFCHLGQNLFSFIHTPAKGDHDDKVSESRLFADFFHCPAFKGEALSVPFIIVTGSPAEAYHRILFFRFEVFSSYKTRIFIGFKITHTHNK